MEKKHIYAEKGKGGKTNPMKKIAGHRVPHYRKRGGRNGRKQNQKYFERAKGGTARKVQMSWCPATKKGTKGLGERGKEELGTA